MLLGNTMFNIGASAFLTTVLVSLVGDKGAIYATALMTVCAGLRRGSPQDGGDQFPERMSLMVARLISVFVSLFGPILFGVEKIVRGALFLCGLRLGEAQALLTPQEELKSAVDLMHKEGGVARSDRDMFGGLLDLRELAVSDVMVHRTKMLALDADLPTAEIVKEVVASPYTRCPSGAKNPTISSACSTPRIFVALSDAGGDATRIKIESITLDAWFVPDTTTLEEQLQAFRKRRPMSRWSSTNMATSRVW